MYEDVLCARLHAGFRTLGVAHLLPAVLDGSLVRGAAVAVADLPHPRLLGAPDRRREEYGRGGADEEGSQSLGSHVMVLQSTLRKMRASRETGLARPLRPSPVARCSTISAQVQGRNGNCREPVARETGAILPLSRCGRGILTLSLIHISEPTRRTPISYAV